MMNKEMGLADVKTQCIAQARHKFQPVAILVGLILAVTSTTPMAWANWSETAGPINGRAPTATGTLNVMFPGGTTPVTNNAIVSTTQKPNDFSVSASALILQDLDGDVGLSATLDAAAATWVWKFNDVPLTPAQLAAPFSVTFLGKTLSVAASAPVTVSSLTGAPTTGSPQIFSSATYTIKVPVKPPTVRVNGYSFAMDSGFPQTGFVGGDFQFWMDGVGPSDNNNYTFKGDPQAPWVNVNPVTGIVTITGEPKSRQAVNIDIIDKRGGAITTYTFTIKNWFVNKGNSTLEGTGPEVDAYCAGLGSGYGTPNYVTVTNSVVGVNPTRAPDGRLWDEWGNLSTFPTSGWTSSGTYWMLERKINQRYYVYMITGRLYYSVSSSPMNVVCSKSL
ncbi:hypothetical protein PGS49_22240 [Yersinia intermedia]|uniref:hypothetical protein n=1 Tax=Yersinia intermedia TaxID=631 RepID=UPI002244D37C|nr:hypothetical protein [Yersinia intermedia]MCW8114060.1 hypothetical protein [Yersinia intermedia]MDA5483329.1 hypothetical protein [Yersinia intermedia]MDA5518693.1 hypothetical protein [Yersinia intermedia]